VPQSNVDDVGVRGSWPFKKVLFTTIFDFSALQIPLCTSHFRTRMMPCNDRPGFFPKTLSRRDYLNGLSRGGEWADISE
jgi:hypothetical protein